MIVTTVFFSILGLYLLKVILFYTGSRRASRPVRIEHRPSVSVIMAARNEELLIEDCLESLTKLRYDGALEIIVVDDQSTDATGELMDRWCERDVRMRKLRTASSLHNLRGKANAIAQALEQSVGEIILTTDADCVVPVEWVQRTVEQYDGATGCVCGFTLIRDEGWFSGMQSLDWAYLLTVASAGVGWKNALSAVGNNMSYRRKAYDDVGGYAGVGFSVTEDFALLKAIAYGTDWQVRYPVEASTLVWSKACPTVREVYRQKKRWGRGGVDSPFAGYAVMSIGFLMNVGIIVAPILGLPLLPWLIGLLGKCVGDAFLLSWPLSRFSQWKLMRNFPLFELYYIIYVTALPFVVLFSGKVVWKDRTL
jgi:1,2-diacylglycerol 3-beta-glucosyltransferase